MKKIINSVAMLSICAVIGCGSSPKVVVDEEGIREQIAKVEAEEQANRAKESAQTKQEVVRPSDADPGAEGSN